MALGKEDPSDPDFLSVASVLRGYSLPVRSPLSCHSLLDVSVTCYFGVMLAVVIDEKVHLARDKQSNRLIMHR